MSSEQQLRVVTVGHVDHGKSTLIGRLLHDTDNLPDGKVAELRAVSERRNVPFEWSFVLDALQTERDQAITIDTTRIWLRVADREIVLIDAPGHEEFLRNMVTGASDADGALLVVDAAEGVGAQTRRHALLLELIGVRQTVVVINKMDLVGYDRARYTQIEHELAALLGTIGIAPLAFIPVVARDGEGIVAPPATMPWYDGPSVVAVLERMQRPQRADRDELRLAVQGVFRRDQERIVVGRIQSGTLVLGQEVIFSPGARRARVKTLETWPHNGLKSAPAGTSVGFTIDVPLFVDRGDVVSDVAHVPPIAHRFHARLLWLGRRALRSGDRLRMRIGTRLARVEIERFERIVDLTTLETHAADRAETNDVVDVVLRSREALALDQVAHQPELARFILLDELDVVAGGTVQATLGQDNLVPVGHLFGRPSREARNGHRGAVIWLTGLPASGKSTIAMHLERRLFERGVQTYVLDGDNLRSGLCDDLGFSEDDRRENIRRAGAVAALFADAGFVAIAAFISPHRAERDAARRAAGDAFHEVYVKADATVCETRDPKGHYAKARAGDLPDFTGVTGVYEPPLEPELVLDTALLSIDETVATALRYVSDHIMLEYEAEPAI